MNRARVHSEAIRERLTEAPDSLRAVAFSGRTLSEYERFFDIGIEEYEERRLLDCASGSASFAAEAMRRNVSVVGVDPLYGRQAGALGETTRWDLEAVLKGVTSPPLATAACAAVPLQLRRTERHRSPSGLCNDKLRSGLQS